MAFLDNSGDIILDAVLTDYGRQLLAKGDGSFKIAKFALGDDEINYALYDKDNSNGTPSYDIDIMTTPVFEAFTNNIASLNSRLLSIPRTNLLYLPVLKVNDKEHKYAFSSLVQNGYILAVDEDTEKFLSTAQYDGNSIGTDGIINGFTTAQGSGIRIDQGVDNKNYPPSSGLERDLVESQYLIEIDNRLGSILSTTTNQIPNFSSLDDDDMASYYFTTGDQFAIVANNPSPTNDTGQVIVGARGTIVKFKIKSSADVSTTDYLFDKLGTDLTSKFGITGASVKSILTTVRVTGLTTGYAIDVPLLVLKYIN